VLGIYGETASPCSRPPLAPRLGLARFAARGTAPEVARKTATPVRRLSHITRVARVERRPRDNTADRSFCAPFDGDVDGLLSTP
jgi:hypothetical protein